MKATRTLIGLGSTAAWITLATCMFSMNCSTTTLGSTFELIPEASTYSYFPSPEGPGMPGCSPSEFQCDFELLGTLDFEVDLDGVSGRFTGGELIALGNEMEFGVDGINLTLPGGALRAAEFDLLSESTGTLIFRDERYSSSGVSPYTLRVEIDGSKLILTGGNDLTPVDGDGFEFSLLAHKIPEPNASSLAPVFALVLLLRHRRAF